MAVFCDQFLDHHTPTSYMDGIWIKNVVDANKEIDLTPKGITDIRCLMNKLMNDVQCTM